MLLYNTGVRRRPTSWLNNVMRKFPRKELAFRHWLMKRQLATGAFRDAT